MLADTRRKRVPVPEKNQIMALKPVSAADYTLPADSQRLTEVRLVEWVPVEAVVVNVSVLIPS